LTRKQLIAVKEGGAQQTELHDHENRNKSHSTGYLPYKGVFCMSGSAQLAQTGVPTLIVGGVAYPIGGWMALAAVLLLGIGLVCLRFRFRPGLSAGQAQIVETSHDGPDDGFRQA
jgi:hypothetical protein